MEPTKKKPHYAFVILAACLLFNGATTGINVNSVSIFFPYIATDICCRVSDIALHSTVSRIVQCLFLLLFIKKIILRYPIRIILVISSVLMASRFVLAFTSAKWLWWVFGMIAGPGIAVSDFFAATLLMERWFKKKLPMMLSIMSVSTGVFTMIFSPIIGNMIESSGWRHAWIVINMLGLLFTAIPNLFVTMNPEDKGMKAYGEDETCNTVHAAPVVSSASATTSASAVTKPATDTSRIPLEKNLVYIFTVAIANAAILAFITNLTVYVQSLSISAYTPALIMSAYAIGNIAFKLLFGVIAEKSSVRNASIFIFITILAGIILLMSGLAYPVLAGGVLLGAGAAIYATILPLLNKHAYGDRYATAVQYTSIFYSIVLAGFNYIEPLIFDITGSYSTVTVSLIVLLLAAIAALCRLFPKKMTAR